jgi:hypothetical protein
MVERVDGVRAGADQPGQARALQHLDLVSGLAAGLDLAVA